METFKCNFPSGHTTLRSQAKRFRTCALLLQLSINFAETFWLEEYHLQGCNAMWPGGIPLTFQRNVSELLPDCMTFSSEDNTHHSRCCVYLKSYAKLFIKSYMLNHSKDAPPPHLNIHSFKILIVTGFFFPWYEIR